VRWAKLESKIECTEESGGPKIMGRDFLEPQEAGLSIYGKKYLDSTRLIIYFWSVKWGIFMDYFYF